MEYAFLPADGGLNTQGRTFYKDGKLHLTWTGCSFEFGFKGTDRVVISFDAYGCEPEGYIKFSLNGSEQVQAVSSGTKNIIILCEKNREYTLKCTRITEGAKDMVISGIKLYGNEPELIKEPIKPKKLIEFIGDSLSCGYGNLGAGSTPVYYSFEQDCTQAFTVQAAEMLGFDYRIVAVSGKGLAHNWDGSTEYRIPEFYNYTSRESDEKWDFLRNEPDITVINAGTNDEVSNTPLNEVRDAALGFIKDVRSKNKNSFIVVAYGFTNKKNCQTLKSVVDELSQSDEKLMYFEFGDIYGKPEEKGANGHPNVLSHTRAAKELTLFIQKNIL